MKCRSVAFYILIALAAGLTVAGAEEKFGVTIYEGAKLDADTTQLITTQMKVNAACYRTSAAPAQVNLFYSKQPGVTAVHASATGGMFKKGEITITVQSPWLNMRTGEHMKDTLISVVKTH